MVHAVRDFARKKRANREQVTSKDVLKFLIAEGHVSINGQVFGRPSTREFASALRVVQRFLCRNGFQRGSKTGAVRFNQQHVAARNEYLRVLLENRALSLEFGYAKFIVTNRVVIITITWITIHCTTLPIRTVLSASLLQKENECALLQQSGVKGGINAQDLCLIHFGCFHLKMLHPIVVLSTKCSPV